MPLPIASGRRGWGLHGAGARLGLLLARKVLYFVQCVALSGLLKAEWALQGSTVWQPLNIE